MNISDKFKQLLKDHIEDLKNNNLDPIFDDDDAFYEYDYFGTGFSPNDARRLLEVQGIDPLRYMNKIPWRYYDSEKLDTLDLSKYTNLKKVENQAFHHCSIGSDLILPDSIEEIQELALSLKVSNLYLPNNLKEVSNEAFDDLKCYNIIYKNKKYDSIDIIEALYNDGVNIF